MEDRIQQYQNRAASFTVTTYPGHTMDAPKGKTLEPPIFVHTDFV
jgi:hypothetical protein